jgi:hypothetical protein
MKIDGRFLMRFLASDAACLPACLPADIAKIMNQKHRGI